MSVETGIYGKSIGIEDFRLQTTNVKRDNETEIRTAFPNLRPGRALVNLNTGEMYEFQHPTTHVTLGEREMTEFEERYERKYGDGPQGQDYGNEIHRRWVAFRKVDCPVPNEHSELPVETSAPRRDEVVQKTPKAFYENDLVEEVQTGWKKVRTTERVTDEWEWAMDEMTEEEVRQSDEHTLHGEMYEKKTKPVTVIEPETETRPVPFVIVERPEVSYSEVSENDTWEVIGWYWPYTGDKAERVRPLHEIVEQFPDIEVDLGGEAEQQSADTAEVEEPTVEVKTDYDGTADAEIQAVQADDETMTLARLDATLAAGRLGIQGGTLDVVPDEVEAAWEACETAGDEGYAWERPDTGALVEVHPVEAGDLDEDDAVDGGKWASAERTAYKVMAAGEDEPTEHVVTLTDEAAVVRTVITHLRAMTQ